MRWHEAVEIQRDKLVKTTPGLVACTIQVDDGNLLWTGKFITAEAAISFLKDQLDEALDYEKLVKEWELVGLDGEWPDWYEAAFGTCFLESHYLDDLDLYEVVWIDGTPQDYANEVERGEESWVVK